MSVRIDQAVLDLVQREIARKPAKEQITEWTERGMILVLRERGVEDPINSHARFVLADEGAVFARQILGLAALIKAQDLTPMEREAREFVLKVIDAAAPKPSI